MRDAARPNKVESGWHGSQKLAVVRTTIRDVAREAGVALWTVSNALTGKSYVLDETRRLVQEVADPPIGLVIAHRRRRRRFEPGARGQSGSWSPMSRTPAIRTSFAASRTWPYESAASCSCATRTEMKPGKSTRCAV
ncbi:MAG: LacI family DNA-binding transcriptional regulator [Hyphomicrobiales bacterium]|nr:LacI family DNA-binding transcriptional regulator [Hyphomicrobiales bacterium]